MLVEQAIFTSAQTERSAGYQLVASSPGVCDADARELAMWGPSHDSLLEEGADAVSINFHKLPSGAFCVSKTTPAGGEYSGRRGPAVYTQCLVVPADGLARFSNNPFALMTAAFAQGSLRVFDRIPDELEPFRLSGRAAAVDQALLGQFLADPGVTWLSAMIEAAISRPAVVLVAGQHRQRLIAGLLNCLPPECRTEFSFSTGLRYSPRRPFRLVCVAGDPADQRRLLRQYDVTVLELSGKPPMELSVTDSWGGFVSCAVATGNTAFLSSQLSQARPALQLTELGPLGNQLLEALADSQKAELAESVSAAALSARSAGEAVAAPETSLTESKSQCLNGLPVDDHRRADAPHARFDGSREAATVAEVAPPDMSPGPSQVLSWHRHEAVESLERLDDLVFEAIAGKPGAFAELKQFWPQVLAELGPELLHESREQYIKHALRIWRECVEGEQIRNPQLAIAAMDVVCLILGE